MNLIESIGSRGRGKRKRRVVTISGSEELVISEETYLKMGLSIGQRLSDDEREEIESIDESSAARQAAFSLLSHRMRSKKEIADRLKRKDFQHSVVNGTIDFLCQAGLVDDRKFATAWINDRLNLKPSGFLLLRRELRQHGIEESIIEELLSEISEVDEVERAQVLLEKRKARYSGLDGQVARRRMTGFLARRGFGSQTTRVVVKRVLENIEE